MARPERGEAFLVIFTGTDPRTVMRVAERLGRLFIDESLRDRQTIAEGTNEFLETQLKEAKERLVEHEKRLQAYKERNAGQLPSQVDTNLRSMTAVQTQAQAILDQINREQERRMQIERDRVRWTAGIRYGRTLGSPIGFAVDNRDWENWTDRMSIEPIPADRRPKPITRVRPGHVDLAGALKYGTDDVRNVLTVQGDTLDWDYIHRWCDEHGTRELLDRLRRSIPPI